jgi:CheY-like chemotaxis protein
MNPNPKILIVDDESSIRYLLSELLSSCGYDVATASDGDEALRCVVQEDFDLVLIDLIMPRKDGIETILELHARRPDTPVIAMSGGMHCGSTNFLPLATKLGARRTLAKPFGGRELLEAVEAEIGKPKSISAA